MTPQQTSWGNLKQRANLLAEILEIRTELLEVERDLTSGTLISEDLVTAKHHQAEVLRNMLTSLERQANLEERR